jgi:hypothetical protein
MQSIKANESPQRWGHLFLVDALLRAKERPSEEGHKCEFFCTLSRVVSVVDDDDDGDDDDVAVVFSDQRLQLELLPEEAKTHPPAQIA